MLFGQFGIVLFARLCKHKNINKHFSELQMNANLLPLVDVYTQNASKYVLTNTTDFCSAIFRTSFSIFPKRTPSFYCQVSSSSSLPMQFINIHTFTNRSCSRSVFRFSSENFAPISLSTCLRLHSSVQFSSVTVYIFCACVMYLA